MNYSLCFGFLVPLCSWLKDKVIQTGTKLPRWMVKEKHTQLKGNHLTNCTAITMADMPCQKKKEEEITMADLTVLHIRELPHLHMKLAVWFSFPTTNNKDPMIPSWSLVSIYNYSFNPHQIFTKNFEILELEICSKIFYMWHDIFASQDNNSLPTSLKKYVLNLVLCQSRNLS